MRCRRSPAPSMAAISSRRPVRISDQVYQLEMDLVVEAIGQEVSPEIAAALGGVEIQGGRIVHRQGSYQTTRRRVFAGGDIRHGAATVVAAVADGMRAAREMNTTILGRE